MPMVEPKGLTEIRQRSLDVLGKSKTSIIVIDNPPTEFIKVAAAAITDRAILLCALDARNDVINMIMPEIVMAEKILSQMELTADDERKCLVHLRAVIKAMTTVDSEEEEEEED